MCRRQSWASHTANLIPMHMSQYIRSPSWRYMRRTTNLYKFILTNAITSSTIRSEN